MKKFIVEINLLEHTENENNDVLYLKRFYETAIGKEDMNETLDRGFKEVKIFVENKLSESHI